jgi:phosphatidylserine decarboxylase
MSDSAPDASLADHGFALLQAILPKHVLSRFIHRLMRTRRPWLKRLLIQQFMKGYAVNMQEAASSDPLAYESFNAFFTRALKTDARTWIRSAESIVSPVDGTASQSGRIDDEALLQAKGHSYRLTELLARDTEMIQSFRDGAYSCIYLAPFNYHRIHMPVSGRLRTTVYVPGELFSVNAATARTVPSVFARNERVICDFDTALGRMSVILVGALFVGSIETVWCGEVNPPPRGRKSVRRIETGAGTELEQGAELGRFNMGSTVILLLPPGAGHWQDSLVAGRVLRMGECIGTLRDWPATRATP